jgi:hypothetical protein
MAKITGPLMSLDASGTIGKTVVFSKWKGQNYTRLRVTPKNPQKDSQQDCRIKLGSTGYALSFCYSEPLGVDNSDFVEAAKTAAPAGQSWISNAVAKITGSAFSTWDDSLVDYTALDPGDKTLYETAAGNLGLAAFVIAKVGTITTVAAGLQLYMLLRFAIIELSYELSAGTLDDPDAGGLADFVSYCQAQA